MLLLVYWLQVLYIVEVLSSTNLKSYRDAAVSLSSLRQQKSNNKWYYVGLCWTRHLCRGWLIGLSLEREPLELLAMPPTHEDILVPPNLYQYAHPSHCEQGPCVDDREDYCKIA